MSTKITPKILDKYRKSRNMIVLSFILLLQRTPPFFTFCLRNFSESSNEVIDVRTFVLYAPLPTFFPRAYIFSIWCYEVIIKRCFFFHGSFREFLLFAG